MLARAVTSVHAQTRGVHQLIVELDRERTGAAATRNRALEHVTSDVTAWCDDDDWIGPSHVEACVQVLEKKPRVDLVYPVPVLVDGDDPTATTYQGRFPVSPWGIRWCPELEAHLRHRGSFIPMCHLVRTEALRRAGGFPPGRTLPSGRYQGEDGLMLIALLDHGAAFFHLDRRTWFWNAAPDRGGTAGLPADH
jgi:glycosyltransferase involved in cell wall biosynthesis